MSLRKRASESAARSSVASCTETSARLRACRDPGEDGPSSPSGGLLAVTARPRWQRRSHDRSGKAVANVAIDLNLAMHGRTAQGLICAEGGCACADREQNGSGETVNPSNEGYPRRYTRRLSRQAAAERCTVRLCVRLVVSTRGRSGRMCALRLRRQPATMAIGRQVDSGYSATEVKLRQIRSSPALQAPFQRAA